MSAKPATPDEAELHAIKAVQDYLNSCKMTHQDQIGNYLMKLCSVAGVIMAKAEGRDQAVMRLEGTAAFIAKVAPKSPSAIHPIQ